MIPTLLVGDLILVNKFHYGIRLPVLNKKIIITTTPARRRDGVPLPPRPAAWTYIKRVSACPGDEVTYQPAPPSTASRCRSKRRAEFFDEDSLRYFRSQYEEKLGGQRIILVTAMTASQFHGARRRPFPRTAATVCRGRHLQGAAWPLLHDGRQPRQFAGLRYWGFVPDENIVGKAFIVWMNFGNPSASVRSTMSLRIPICNTVQFDQNNVAKPLRQAGLTLFGLLFWAMVCAVATGCGVPHGWYYTIQRAVEKAAKPIAGHRAAGRARTHLRPHQAHRRLDQVDHRQDLRSPRKRQGRHRVCLPRKSTGRSPAGRHEGRPNERATP